MVYTDVWASMGQEHEADRRREPSSRPSRSIDAAGGLAREAIFLHCLPAHRGEEVTGDVLDGPRSHGHPPGRQPAPLPEGAARLADAGKLAGGLDQDAVPKAESSPRATEADRSYEPL